MSWEIRHFVRIKRRNCGGLGPKGFKSPYKLKRETITIDWKRLGSRLNPLLYIWEIRYIKWITNLFLINFLISTKLAWFLNFANPISFFPPSFIDSSMNIPHVRVQDRHTMHGIHVIHDCHFAHIQIYLFILLGFLVTSVVRPTNRTTAPDS